MVSEALISCHFICFLISLNPCFSGRWSRSHNREVRRRSANNVLILVLVEDGLGVSENVVDWWSSPLVLILVLVEDGLGVDILMPKKINKGKVLILVLVEDGLEEQNL